MRADRSAAKGRRVRTSNASRHTTDGDEAGSAFVSALAIIAAVLLVGCALFILGTGESHLVEHTVDSAQAFCLAEAGQTYARAWLRQCAEGTPPVYPEEASFIDRALGGGEYEVDIAEVAAEWPWLVEYDVVATGDVGGVRRGVRTILRSETFAQFCQFVGGSTDAELATGDSLYGPVHANGHIKIGGDTWFGGKVTSSEDDLIVKEGTSPVFAAGYELGVSEVSYASAGEVAAGLTAEAQSGGVYCGTFAGKDAGYEVVLGRDGVAGRLSYRRTTTGAGGSSLPWTDVDVWGTNGVFWFELPILISGTLDGEITVGCAGDVLIVDDIRYSDSSAGLGPDPGCNDMLGVVAMGDIVVADTAPNENDCELHGHFMSLSGGFTAEAYNQGSPRGDIIVWGGIAEANGEPVGKYGVTGVISGYNRDFHFDARLMSKSPPYYPLTGRYVIVSWDEVDPSEA